jgi:hypothetical protein
MIEAASAGRDYSYQYRIMVNREEKGLWRRKTFGRTMPSLAKRSETASVAADLRREMISI